MTRCARFARILSVAAISLMLTACGANIKLYGAAPQSHRSEVSVGMGDLLYVSDLSNVYVYDFPSGKPDMLLNGLVRPAGMCVDRRGDIWVAEYGFEQIVRLLHGGNTVVSTLHDPAPGEPLGCAVDDSTGEVAATNYAGNNQGNRGAVVIFRKAVNYAQVYHAPDMFFYFFCTYDGDGDLFVNGQDEDENVSIVELPKGSSQFRKISLRGLPRAFHYPGGIAWDGHELALADYDRGVIYHLRLQGPIAFADGTTVLAGANGLNQIEITETSQGLVLAAANNQSNTAMAWKYPEGGPALNAFSSGNFPIGAVISSPPSGEPLSR